MGIIDEIKKEAKGNRTTIQSSEGQRLCTILNRLFYLEKNIKEETKFIKQVMTRGAETQERIGLHASELIKGDKDFCLRKQVLSLMYEQLQGQQISVGLKRIFEEGNAIHEKWQRLFIRGNYSNADNLDVTQFNDKYKISFTPDIICEIPEFYKGKMVGEIKSVGTYQFQKMTRHPSAYKQLQWYMYLTGIHKGFVLCDDKNSQEFKCEIYDFDKELVEPFVERAEQIKYYHNRVLKENKMVKRPADAKEPTCKRCKECSMRNACWKIDGGGKLIK